MPPQRCVGSSVRENPRGPKANQAVLGAFCKAGLGFGGARRLCHAFSWGRGLISGLIAKHFHLWVLQCAADELLVWLRHRLKQRHPAVSCWGQRGGRSVLQIIMLAVKTQQM